MGEVVDLLTGRPWRPVAAAPSIDALTVEVTVAIWRLGGQADGAAIAEAVAQGRGRSDGFTRSERLALEQAIVEGVVARAEKRLEPLLHPATDNNGGWALSRLARAVLGERP